MFHDIPLLILATVISCYWGTVGLLVVYKRLRHGRSAGVLPKDRFERWLWILILPVVALWITLPILAVNGRLAGFAVPAWVLELPAIAVVRCFAAGVAIACYLLSLYCWLLMGRSWSMAIVPKQTTGLVTSGVYRWVRHPIYSLSIGLMLASVVVLPILPMAVLACLHLIAFNLKARHEEDYLTASFGPAYTSYCHRVGRFWPRLSSRSVRSMSEPDA